MQQAVLQLRTHTTRMVLCALVIVSILVFAFATPARAAGETYTLTTTPTRVQEANGSGVTIVVTVHNAMFSAVGIPYAFSTAVADPSGSSKTASSNVLSVTSSWSFSLSYPSGFSGASMNLVGIYSVNVSQTVPTMTSNVVSGSFLVGITDLTSYQRTNAVQIQAGGYLPTDTINVTVTRSSGLVTAFKVSTTPNTSGLVFVSWQTLPGTTTGLYTVNVIGKNTPAKAVPDTQQFIVYPTNITASNFSVNKSALEKSEGQAFSFNATYINGGLVTQGSTMIRFTEPDGTTTHLAGATYNSSLREFNGVFAIPLSGETGAWKATLDPLSLTDSYGNGGPLATSSLTFNVLPATLVVTLPSSSQIFNVGDTLTLQASILTPGVSNFTQGSVQASMTLSGRQVGSPFSLTYDPTRGQWVGSYRVAPTDPTGAWLFTVSASDSYGNSGQSSVVYAVAGGSQPSTSMLWSYVLAVLLVAAFGFIILITRKKGLTRREVKLDLQAIKTQADKVKDDDFLKSIHAQLQRRKKEVGLEKPDKND